MNRYLALLLLVAPLAAYAQTHPPGLSGWEAFFEVVKGNERFANGRAQHPAQNDLRRSELTAGQRPHTIVLSCSDSRVPPEIIFDQGLGNLFVIRTAGEVADLAVVASIEYAVEHLAARLLIVMGHESCGAVKAAIETPEGKSAGSPDLDQLIATIRPHISSNLGDLSDKRLRQPVRAQVSGVARDLIGRSTIVREAVELKGLIIAEAIYGLDSGKVDFYRVGRPQLIEEQLKSYHQSAPGFPSDREDHRPAHGF